MKSRSGNPAKRAWEPMKRGEINPVLVEVCARMGMPEIHEAWQNNLYQCIVRRLDNGWMWLSIKRHDRAAVRDWRHLQQIKNEVVGPEREAVEMFPAESRLMDTANEYALFVFPEGERLPVGWTEREVATPEEIDQFNAAGRSTGLDAKARQRPWQEGLTTGR